MKKSRRMWKIENLIKAEGNDILHSRNHKSTRKAIQHGNVSVRRHAINVARYSLLINEKLGIKCNKRDLIRGALLHDYFLYDWHDPSRKREGLHGFVHPKTALKNAREDFELSPVEENIIVRHMFPLTPHPPACREAWLVCAADKYCALQETVHPLFSRLRRRSPGAKRRP